MELQIRQADRFVTPLLCSCMSSVWNQTHADLLPDFAGGTNFVVLAIITLAFSGHHNARQIVVSLFIMIWGARLSGTVATIMNEWAHLTTTQGFSSSES